MSSELLPNQHHEDVTAESVRRAILVFVDQWTRAACDDCCPTILDDALDGIDRYGPQFRRVGIELASTGQNMCDELIAEAPVPAEA